MRDFGILSGTRMRQGKAKPHLRGARFLQRAHAVREHVHDFDLFVDLRDLRVQRGLQRRRLRFARGQRCI